MLEEQVCSIWFDMSQISNRENQVQLAHICKCNKHILFDFIDSQLLQQHIQEYVIQRHPNNRRFTTKPEVYLLKKSIQLAILKDYQPKKIELKQKKEYLIISTNFLIENLIDALYQIKNSLCQKVSLLLIGNKVDVSKRLVTLEEGQDLAQQFGIPFFETSAKDGTNVSDAFFQMAKLKKEIITQEKILIQQQPAYLIKEVVQAQQIEQNQDIYQVFKALIIGNTGVGKTNILLRLCENSFQPLYISTMGMRRERKQKCKFGIPPGRKDSKQQLKPKGANALILVYSVEDKQTFNNIENWINQYKKFGSENICKLLIGNKIDSANRQVTEREGKTLAKYLVSHFVRLQLRWELILQMLFKPLLSQQQPIQTKLIEKIKYKQYKLLKSDYKIINN